MKKYATRISQDVARLWQKESLGDTEWWIFGDIGTAKWALFNGTYVLFDSHVLDERVITVSNDEFLLIAKGGCQDDKM